jgi:F0F1-type ATP synthase membrane subunit b/b'
MDGTESLSTILIRTIIQVGIFIIVLGILYFVAYKPIRRIMNKYLKQNNSKPDILDKQKIENIRKFKDISEETNRTIKELDEEIYKIKEQAAKDIEEEEKEILESIITKSQKTINKEHDNAIKQLRSEYEHLITDYQKSDVTSEEELGYSEKPSKKTRRKNNRKSKG